LDKIFQGLVLAGCSKGNWKKEVDWYWTLFLVLLRTFG